MTNHSHDDGFIVKNARLAVASELKKKRALNQPIAKFDAKTKQVYIQNSDGSTIPFAKAMTRGRYSERSR
ncbi:MAG TPA: hypothetical protein H9746_09605 [Candidatus Butyricicoccus avistercoris]|mgnify:CR=1 FL=1|uniref:Uncharacterized protein n=1 Tax=Candidatus Butyricicoccus avistercoris TaxID=2838518 RepID=A0A9D1TIQ4_9FIRM|nr:hypothetical protein [Candidatus Butyricicoccus avistercoris]